jgi:hypothetical protein
MTSPVRMVSAFTTLVHGVQAYFTALGQGSVVVCGYRERAKQLNQGAGGANRVIFLPGDINGAGGKLEASPRDVGRRDVEDAMENRVAVIRPLASWARQFTISVWGWDSTAPRDELLQAAAVEDLFEKTVQAVEQVTGAGGPNLLWGNTVWTVPKENTLGAELLVGVALTHPLMDAADDVAFPGFTLVRAGE